MNTASLLVELFTEELPPKSLKKLGDAFAEGLVKGLTQRGLVDNGVTVARFATPRRLAVHIAQARAVAPDQNVTRKLMPVSVGLDAEGRATPALQKKLAALGRADIDVSALATEGEGKATQLVLHDVEKGQSLQAALQSALDEAIAGLPVAKVMSYQLTDGATTVQFVRPVHGLVALHGEDVVAIRALGHDAGRVTHGHRFQGAKDIALLQADEYESRLELEGGVVASFDKRKAEIHRLLLQRAEECGDTLGEPADYAALLDEVTALVERPTVYVGKFDAESLTVPAECLILTMKLNQKYFPLFLSEGGLSSRFLIVSNMRLDDPGNVIEGNERVVRPRLADARFFFETDKKMRLEDRIAKLGAVVYHNKLGSQGERVERVRKLARAIAAAIGADANLADRAALLAKADLVTDMVGEFPELQGTMGRYYALHDGESPVVASAIAEHYQPRFAGDALPASDVALAVAMADKMETLAGLFSIGQVPTGDKDPFALRRHAIGVIRSLVDRSLPIEIGQLIQRAAEPFTPKIDLDSGENPSLPIRQQILEQRTETFRANITLLREFLEDRLAVNMRDRGYSLQQVDSVLGIPLIDWTTIVNRLDAVREFVYLPEAASLAAANKRIGNILKKSNEQFGSADPALFADDAERALHAAVLSARPVFDKFLAARDYTSALKSLAPLKAPVDAFFDAVMVNAEDPKLRTNRHALLSDLHGLMNQVADLAKLAA